MRRGLLIVLTIMLIVTAGANWRSVAAQTEGGACGTGAAVEAGSAAYQMEAGGLTRSYRVYIPASYDGTQPVPLVLSLHGFASNPAQQEAFSNWDSVADAENFIVAYPAGTGTPLRWNSGLFSEQMGERTGNPVDDVQFLADLIDHLAATYCIDPTRVYINGLSNGGGMSYRFACTMADRIAAMGGVAGAYNQIPGGCEPSQPVPVILFHGTADPIVPYEGGASDDPGVTDFPSVPEFAAAWAERNGCAATPETMPDLPASVEATRYTGCANDVEVAFYTLIGGGHTWAGSGVPIPRLIAGETNTDIEASAVMWEFFQRYTRE